MDKKTLVIMILEGIVFIGIIVAICNFMGNKINTLDQNLLASKDKVTELTLENGNLLADKAAYVLKSNQLEEMLDITKKEKKEIERKLDEKIAYISTIESNIKIDTLEVIKETVVYKDSTLNIKFDYNDNWLKFSGGTYYNYNKGISKTTIYGINIPVPLRVGLTDDYTIFVESKNPYLNITDIEGAVIDGSKLYPKKRKWNLGVHAGMGVHYGLFGQQVDVGPYVGVGIGYNF